MSKLLSLLILSISFAFAGTNLAPKNFNENGKLFVFIDIQTANYDVVYDVDNTKTTAVSKIVFDIPQEGYPLFDLKPEIKKIIFGKQQIQALSVDLPDGGKMKALDIKLAPGIYTFEIFHEIEENVEYKTWFSSEVRSAFWMSDLSDRQYLEQYLPTNLEYDQIKMFLSVKVIGTDTEHVLKTNGTITESGLNQFTIEYPEFYAASSIFFHLYPKGAFAEKDYIVKSIDGRQIHFQVYTKSSWSLGSFTEKATEVFHELEKDYGVWPHPHLIVYGAGSGGMEYVGATQTSLYALGHEMHHSYFARGMIPARGNDGWIDEALASWRDKKYRQSSLDDLSKTKMSGHSSYQRTTDTSAYGAGERIIGHFDQRFNKQGGMIPFLKSYASNKMYRMNTTKYFKKSLEEYFNTNLDDFFNSYIYGKDGIAKQDQFDGLHNPYHKVLSKKELIDLL